MEREKAWHSFVEIWDNIVDPLKPPNKQNLQYLELAKKLLLLLYIIFLAEERQTEILLFFQKSKVVS